MPCFHLAPVFPPRDSKAALTAHPKLITFSKDQFAEKLELEPIAFRVREKQAGK